MQPENPVFNKNLSGYLKQLGEISIAKTAPKLGAIPQKDSAKIKLFNTEYTVSAKAITGPSGRMPGYDVCIMLSRYFLCCPDQVPKNKNIVSYRDFKDSGPLINFFTNDIERAIAGYFSNRPGDLKKANHILGGYPPELDVAYDFSTRFDALPMIPVILLFNDADEEFPAKSSVLFEHRAQHYLDAECLAMLGRHLFHCLKKAC